MLAYKTIMWDGQEYSVPVEMKWLTVDEDGEVNVWDIKPRRTSEIGFWVAKDGRNTRLTEGSACPSWKETLTSI